MNVFYHKFSLWPDKTGGMEGDKSQKIFWKLIVAISFKIVFCDFGKFWKIDLLLSKNLKNLLNFEFLKVCWTFFWKHCWIRKKIDYLYLLQGKKRNFKNRNISHFFKSISRRFLILSPPPSPPLVQIFDHVWFLASPIKAFRIKYSKSFRKVMKIT